MNDLGRIDWNLIPVLDALLTERSVSKAARHIGVTQPAMSNSLQRLRRHFQDELLVRHGGAYRLTPLAQRLAPLTRDIVQSSRDVVSSGSTFDPDERGRRFVIAATGAMQATFVPLLIQDLNRLAPKVQVAFVSPFVEPYRTSEDVIASTDGWLAPREMLPGHRFTGQISDEWVCVVWADNSTVGEELTLGDVANLPWVAPTIRGIPLRVHHDVLLAHGIEPVVDIYTESFTAVPFLVEGTNRIGILQRRVAEKFSAVSSTRVLPCPWPVQPLVVTFWWNETLESDPGHVWLRNFIETSMDRYDRRFLAE